MNDEIVTILVSLTAWLLIKLKVEMIDLGFCPKHSHPIELSVPVESESDMIIPQV